MDANTLPHAYQAALFLFNGLRCLGFPSEHIFFTYDPVKGMFVSVEHDGRKWSIRCGALDLSYESWEVNWRKVTTAMLDGSLTEDSLDKLWERWAPHRMKIVEDLVFAGIPIPNIERDKARMGIL
jgi:hypothetical protein